MCGYSTSGKLNNELGQYKRLLNTVSALETWRLGCKFEHGRLTETDLADDHTSTTRLITLELLQQ